MSPAIAWGVRMGLLSFPKQQVNISKLDERTGREVMTRPERAARRAEMVARLWDGKRWKPPAQRTAQEQREFIMLMNYRRAAERRGQPSGIPHRVRDTSRTRRHLETIKG